ncbi:MAG: hypothetical protein JXJ20_05065 [Anaerolineae bacterium]|nr:hypothetical protein [Anaerolineae bacterium]
MADDVTLKAYLKDLNVMLERESPTEVVSHCRYILQHFPQNAETYRLLGKALLQKGHSEGREEYFDEAAEVFQRVLSVLPNDYAAHIGLSEIREQQNQLDQALWHLEQAYEQMPGNAMLQGALRDLYVKRQGKDKVPEKLQLTRGALARQYVNAGLIDQALVELRAALEQAPQRIDLQVLLAETLWENQYKIEAGEVAIGILKKLPNCLPANRIMAQLWLDYQRPTDARPFLERVEAVNPYEALRVVQPDADPASDTNVLPHLDYTAKAAAVLSAETPDWVEQLGDLGSVDDIFQVPAEAPQPDIASMGGPERIDTDAIFGGVSSRAEEEPDWLRHEPVSPGEPEVPDWYSGGVEAYMPEDESPAMTEPVEPDWLDEAGPPSAPEVPDWFAEVPEPEPSPVSPPDSAAVEADWLSFDEETGTEDTFAADGDTAAEQAAPARGIRGFTDLLHGIETTHVPPGSSDDVGDIEPVAPDWLSAFDEDETPEQPEAETPEMGAPADDSLIWLPEDTGADVPQAFDQQDDWFAEMEEFATAEPDQVAVDEWPEAEEQPAIYEPPAIDEEEWLASFEEPELDAEEAEDSLPHTPEAEIVEMLDQLPLAELVDEDAFEASRLVEEEPSGEEVDWLSEDQDAMDWMQPIDLGDEALFEAEEPSEVIEEDLAMLRRAAMPPSDMDFDEVITAKDLDTEVIRGAKPEEPEPEAALDWLTEPELDFFAPGALESEAPALQDQGSGAVDDWLTRIGQAETEDWAAEPDDFDGSAWDEPEALPRSAQAQEDLADVDDWLADLEELDEAELVSAMDAGVEEEPPASLAPEIEPASELLDWLSETRSEEDVSFVAEKTYDEAWDEMELSSAELNIAADDLSALFDAQEETLGAAEQVQWEAEEAQPTPEAEAGEAMDWLQPDTDEADWLGSFAKAEVEDAAPADIPAPEAIETDEWLSEMPVPDMDMLAEELTDDELLFDAMEEVMFGTEEPLAEETGMAASVDTMELEAAPDTDMEPLYAEPEITEDVGPAWLADMMPVEAPPAPSDQAEPIMDEAYDPFAAGRPDQVPAYESAKDTGILQPDEHPDWMTAFTGEELLPEADLDAEFEAAPTTRPLALDDRFGEDEAEDGFRPESVTVKEPITDSLTDMEFEDWTVQREAGSALPAAEVGAEDEMPDWLDAITRSEADKLDDMFPDEQEKYSSAEDTGVLQPGSEADWLPELSRHELAEAEPGEEFFAEQGLKDGLVEESGVIQPLSRPESLPEIGERRVEAQPAEIEPGETEERVAQRYDLAHTKDAESVVSVREPGLGEAISDQEHMPDDFSFDDYMPAWLRQPKEHEPDLSTQADLEPPAEPPEWLREVFEEDKD